MRKGVYTDETFVKAACWHQRKLPVLRVAEAELGLTSSTMKITSLITILVAAMVEGKEDKKYRIVQSSPAVMVKEGSKTKNKGTLRTKVHVLDEDYHHRFPMCVLF